MPSPIMIFVTTVPSNTAIVVACLLGHTLSHLLLLLQSIPLLLHSHINLLPPDNNPIDQKEVVVDSV